MKLNLSIFSKICFLIAISSLLATEANAQDRETFLSQLNKNNREGEISLEEKQAFVNFLQGHQEINSVLEIGLNRGASAEVFLETLPNLKYFASFDIAYHECVPYVAEYFASKYFPKFHFVRGDTRSSLPTYLWLNPERVFDLIFVDGGHDYEVALSDILHCRLLAHPGTVLLVDDYNYESVRRAVDSCVAKGVIAIDAVHPEGLKWVEAHYLFSK